MRLKVLDTNTARAGGEAAPAGAGRMSQEDAAELERTLRETVDGEIRFGKADRALYATDSSNYRQVPIGVVVPRTTEAVVATVAACRKFGAPIVSRGGGTSLAGQCCNVAVVMDHSKYLNKILEIDPERRLARVQPGCVLDTLRERAIKEHGLTFGPDPSTHAWCTLGGMIGNNSCGVHSVMTGRTSDCTLGLEILTYDGLRLRVGPTSDEALAELCARKGRVGEIYCGLRDLRDRAAELVRARYPKIPRRVSGYNLDELLPEKGFNVASALVGTEGTCVVVLEATLRLIEWPAKRTIVVLGYPDIFSAGDHVPQIMEHKPIGLEGIDEKLINHMKERHLHLKETQVLPKGKGWLLAEFGGRTQEEADQRAKAMVEAIEREEGAPKEKMLSSPDQEHDIWDVRESGLGATAFVPNHKDSWEGWEDAAVPPDRVGAYLRDFRKLLDKYDYDTVMYGHFGQGCIHCRIDCDLYTEPGVEKYRGFIGEAADLVVSHGGSLSGEHGDGQSKAAMLVKMFGPELMVAFRDFKRLWDPEWRMNPGKVVDPNPPTSDLRLGAGYEPRQVKTHFAYPDDHDSFARSTLRCVGVGKCRRNHDAFMCPTYRVTMEEKHTTRGRAHMLFEMMRGDFLTDGWRDKGVLESLDLCIGCKGCKHDCPVNVDIGTYKSEFLAHHYAGRLRPRHHYSMGFIGWWARLAAIAPEVANFFGQTPPLRSLARWVAGVSPNRNLPVFASETFRQWRSRQPEPTAGGEPVVLLVDVFNDSFYPDTLRAGERVLRCLGHEVIIGPRLPAVRPLIHYGWLTLAKRSLRTFVERLRPFARQGVPIIGFEPSTVAVLREERTRLLPQDQDAARIRDSAKMFSELVADKVKHHGLELPRRGGRAVVHLHCHEKAVLQPEATRAVLRAMEIEIDEPEQGCCGMAGSFGFEREHYDLSMAIGERKLLPRVRDASEETLLVAPGFSCRTQIRDATGRLPLHPAELLQGVVCGRASAGESIGGTTSGGGAAEVFVRPPAGGISPA